MKSWLVTIQMKATEQYSLVVLFILLYKVVPKLEPVNEIQNLAIPTWITETFFFMLSVKG